MGKPTGFMEYQRVLPGYRDPLARIQDWQEIANEMDEIQLQQQAARCMNCGTPFCHTGCLVDGKVSGCPLHNLMPEWNDLVYRGLWEEAFKRLEKRNIYVPPRRRRSVVSQAAIHPSWRLCRRRAHYVNL